MQLDHLNLFVSDLAASRAFYEALLPDEGLPVNRDFPGVAVGFGHSNYAVFALVAQTEPVQPIHVAFRVDSRSDVERLYAQAIDHGAVDYGAPGPRPHYHEHYFAGFVLDPDKHILEFVCHTPPTP